MWKITIGSDLKHWTGRDSGHNSVVSCDSRPSTPTSSHWFQHSSCTPFKKKKFPVNTIKPVIRLNLDIKRKAMKHHSDTNSRSRLNYVQNRSKVQRTMFTRKERETLGDETGVKRRWHDTWRVGTAPKALLNQTSWAAKSLIWTSLVCREAQTEFYSNTHGRSDILAYLMPVLQFGFKCEIVFNQCSLRMEAELRWRNQPGLGCGGSV